MKNGTILKVFSIVLAFLGILAIVCAVTATGSGFLDLSNFVRAICFGVALVCNTLAVLAWKASKQKD